MTKTITMPALSPTMEEGTIARWLVQAGDSVAAGDAIAEIETDKATMEVEAEEDGVLSTIEVAAGTEDVKVGTVIATFTATRAEQVDDSNPAADSGSNAEGTSNLEAVGARDPAPSKASPLAGRVAEAEGIEASALTGSGPSGRVVGADVESAEPVAQVADQVKPTAETGSAPFESTTLSSMRKTIARRLTESKQQIPHIYLTVDIDLDRLLALRAEMNVALDSRGVRLSVNDFLIKALALALVDVPECNVQLEGDQLLKFQRSDISVAVSIPGGLITPIIIAGEQKGVASISTEMKRLAERAREGKLAPHEYQGGTASLSNMGMFGIRQFQAVINPPQAMIMAVGSGEPRPVAVNGAVEVATIMSATGSFDHRVIDGADGARLMGAFRSLVENPLRILG